MSAPERYYIVKRTRRGWAVYGQKPGDPSLHYLTREEAEADAKEMNESRAQRCIAREGR